MGVGQNSVAAATAVLGYDLATGQIWQQSSVDRALTKFGMAGSAAALDTKVSLYVDTTYIGEFYNSATGAVLIDQHGIPLDMNFVPAGAQIHIYVTDAPGTNPINIVLCWDEVEED